MLGQRLSWRLATNRAHGIVLPEQTADETTAAAPVPDYPDRSATTTRSARPRGAPTSTGHSGSDPVLAGDQPADRDAIGF
ncbi:MAG: hypothetical protein V7646_3894, partial [Pseudonocardia sp.]